MSHQHLNYASIPSRYPACPWWYNKGIRVPTIAVSYFLVYYGTGQ